MKYFSIFPLVLFIAFLNVPSTGNANPGETGGGDVKRQIGLTRGGGNQLDDPLPGLDDDDLPGLDDDGDKKPKVDDKTDEKDTQEEDASNAPAVDFDQLLGDLQDIDKFATEKTKGMFDAYRWYIFAGNGDPDALKGLDPFEAAEKIRNDGDFIKWIEDMENKFGPGTAKRLETLGREDKGKDNKATDKGKSNTKQGQQTGLYEKWKWKRSQAAEALSIAGYYQDKGKQERKNARNAKDPEMKDYFNDHADFFFEKARKFDKLSADLTKESANLARQMKQSTEQGDKPGSNSTTPNNSASDKK